MGAGRDRDLPRDTFGPSLENVSCPVLPSLPSLERRPQLTGKPASPRHSVSEVRKSAESIAIKVDRARPTTGRRRGRKSESYLGQERSSYWRVLTRNDVKAIEKERDHFVLLITPASLIPGREKNSRPVSTSLAPMSG